MSVAIRKVTTSSVTDPLPTRNMALQPPTLEITSSTQAVLDTDYAASGQNMLEGDPKQQPVLRHAFVSYSHKDRIFANELIAELRKAGVPIWIDHEGLTPGTPNWDRSIRKAISESFAALLIASPDSQESDIVQGEMAVAKAQNHPIFPVWARGEIWEECVPLDLIDAQRFDCRGERKESAVQSITAALLQIMKTRSASNSSASFGQRPTRWISIDLCATYRDTPRRQAKRFQLT